MKFGHRLGVSLAVLACVMVVCVLAVPTQQPQEVSANESTNKRMGGLLDFANYKRLFNKSYSGMLEEAVRFKQFTASALKTAAAAIKYRFRFINYYLSLNHMSDWTREEFERMKNKAFAKWARSVGKARGQKPPASPPSSSLPELVPGADESVAEEVRELVDERKAQKVEFSEDRALPPRELPMEKLIHAGEAEQSPEESPLVEPAELSKRGLSENQLPMAWHSFESHDKAIYELGASMQEIDATAVRRQLVKPVVEEHSGEPHSGDQVFVDLRETGCIFPVRLQQGCGACYAFAATTIMEFLYCKVTGQKLALSEQYMVDCGHHVGLNGCSGGSPLRIPNFVRNFGLYPRALYPYQHGPGQCPYDGASVQLEQTGYIRVDEFANSLMISRELWGDALKHGPLMIGTVAEFDGDFYRYGGGVLTGDCQGQPAHAVALIGHGRQDGLEYWLIRNSWGSDWGEDGYIKVEKGSNCIGLDLGFAHGVSSPGQFGEMTFVVNEANDAEAVSRIYGDKGQSEDDAIAVSGQ